MSTEGLKFNLGVSRTGDVVIDTLVNHGVKDIDAYSRGTLTMPMMNPANLYNIDKAYNRLSRAISTNEKIGILVDSDADGMTSASLLYKALIEIGANVSMFFLSEKSHGLKDTVTIISDNEYTLVLTPDSSSNDIDEHKKLAVIGVDVIVLDHHVVEIDIEETPAIIVNNQLPQNKDANKNYVGVGMVFLFLQYINDLEDVFDMDNFLPWLAFGQITDISNISDPELHYIVRKGLSKMKEHPLFSVMLEGAEATPHSIGFDVAPKVNAVSRIGSYTERASLLEALTANMSTLDKEVVAQRRKDKITGKFRTIEVHLNKYEVEYEQLKKIKSLQDRITKKALDKIQILSSDDDSIILALLDDETPRSVTGLIANKLANKNQRPALVVVEDEAYYNGSMRSYGNFEMRTWLNSTGIASASGHEYASGVEFLVDDHTNLLQKASGLNVRQDYYDVDAIYNEYTISNKPLTQVNDSIAMFGGDVKEPVLGFESVPIDSRFIKLTGSTLMFAINNVSFIMFNGIWAYELLKQQFPSKAYYDIVGNVNRNNWGGKITNQIIISDIALSRKDKSGIEMPDELVF